MTPTADRAGRERRIEDEQFWFELYDRHEPMNVVRRDRGIRYHRWSERHRAWVADNSLFLDTDGPDARSREFRPVAAAEALRWLEEHTSYEPAAAGRVITVDAEMRAAGPAGRPVTSVEDAAETLASVLRADDAALARARRSIESLDGCDATKHENPWYFDDRRGSEWMVATMVHGLIDVGDDPAVVLETERCLREAVALVDAN